MEFIKGMDISMVKELEVSGASYYINGKQEDLFRILKECGTTMVRLTTPVSPSEGSTWSM